jgi:hypothetical protein
LWPSATNTLIISYYTIISTISDQPTTLHEGATAKFSYFFFFLLRHLTSITVLSTNFIARPPATLPTPSNLLLLFLHPPYHCHAACKTIIHSACVGGGGIINFWGWVGPLSTEPPKKKVVWSSVGPTLLGWTHSILAQMVGPGSLSKKIKEEEDARFVGPLVGPA